MSYLVEAWFARAEGVGAVGDAVRLVAVAALSPVTPAVIQFGVWAQTVKHAGRYVNKIRSDTLEAEFLRRLWKDQF